MKIGMLVGAVGLALTAVASADRGASMPVSDQTALNAQANGPVIASAADLRAARERAIGVRGSEQFRRAVAATKRGIADGSINPSRVLFDSTVLGLETDEPAPAAAINPLVAEAGAEGRTPIAGSNYAYFDGMETYVVETTPGNNTFDVAGRFNAQVAPGGLANQASSMFIVVELPLPAFVDGGGFQYSAAVPNNPNQPVANAPWTGDLNPATQSALMDGRGSRVTDLAQTFLGYRTRFGRAVGGVLVPPPTNGVPYIPISGQDLIILQDYFFGDYETLNQNSPSSSLEGFIISRYIPTGVSPDDPQADPDGRIRKPLVLGLFPGNFTIGQFYSSRELGGPGQPPTYRTKINEWYTIALRLTAGNEMNWWVRDSGTTGQAGGNNILIDDPRNIPFFETQWAELFPGQAPGAAVPMGSVTKFNGYGLMVDEFGADGPTTGVAPAGLSADNIFTLITNGPDELLPGWKPTNSWQDNFAVIGSPLEVPPAPKLRLPYKDDIELYTLNVSLRFQGSRWVDNLSSGAVVVNDFAFSPTKSVLQRSILEDSFMREEFSTRVPPGLVTSPDFDPSNRAFASPGNPVRASARIRKNLTTAVRGVLMADNLTDNVAEFLLLGASDVNDIVTNRYFVRLPNPTFDENLPTATNARVDDLPRLQDNVFNINWTTTSAVTLNTFNLVELVLFGDGTAAWEVNGSALTFDMAFYNLDTRLQDELKKAKRIQLGLPASTPLSDPALNPPYNRFLSDQKTLDDIGFWSGNNVGSFNDRIYVDDIMLNAAFRVVGAGPAFTAPYCDDMETYVINSSVGGQGASPFAAQLASFTFQQANIRGRWVDAATFPAAADSCLYTVQEVLANGAVWSVANGSTIQVRKPFAGYNCPTRASVVGSANLNVIDPAGARAALAVRVGAPADVNNNGAAATVRADDDRYDASSYFCRYTINSINAQPDFGNGGVPFVLPTGLVAGAIVAIDAPFAVNAITGIRACPGSINSSGAGASTPFNYFTPDRCLAANGNLTLRAENIAPNPCGTGTAVGNATNNTPNTDVKGFSIVLNSVARWTDLSVVSFAAGGVSGDGWVRDAQTETNAVTTASIDASGAFGQVVTFINNAALAPDADGGLAGAVALPTVTADMTGNAGIYWDVYAQDTNSRIVFVIAGPEGDCDGGADFVAAIRLGGPNSQTLPQGTIHIANNENLETFTDTGVAFPVGQWFRMGLEVDSNGDWSLGFNTTGAPGGANDNPGFYALPGSTPAANATFVASGSSLGTSNQNGTRISAINDFSVRQGYDEEGDGIASLGRVDVEALANNAARPAGLGALDFCFYTVEVVDGTPTGPTIVPVNPATGAVSGAARRIGNTDVIAVRYNSVAANGPVVTSFSQCPVNGTFRFLPQGANPGTGTGTEGDWTLAGQPDVEVGPDNLPPRGGISNADGISDNLAYNDPNRPARTILLARFVTIPPLPESENNSQWWLDNLCVKLSAGATPCPADLTGDGQVNSADLAFLLGAWGPNPGSPADLTGDGQVNSGDLASLLGAWGACP